LDYSPTWVAEIVESKTVKEGPIVIKHTELLGHVNIYLYARCSREVFCGKNSPVVHSADFY
jgi:hypothetical protein